MQLSAKTHAMKLVSLTNTTSIGFNSAGISLGADVAMNNKRINGLTNLTTSGTLASDIATTNT